MVSGASTIIGVLTGRRNSRSLSSAASKRSMTRRAEQRVYSAESKATARTESLEMLEADLSEAVAAVTDEWQAKADQVGPEIGLNEPT
jgi:predicted RNA-binding Zn ribbon-like protein